MRQVWTRIDTCQSLGGSGPSGNFQLRSAKIDPNPSIEAPAMRMPRFRFSVRGLMIAVAIAGFVLACIAVLSRRRDRFLVMRDYYISHSGHMTFGRGPTNQQVRRQRWGSDLVRKYDRAA